MADDPLRPVVFCGPSGVGKGTLIELLMKRFPNDQFGFSVSHTTRPPREGEVDGVHYNFTTVDVMKKDIEAGKFIEYAEVHGKYYGTRFVLRVLIKLVEEESFAGFHNADFLCSIRTHHSFFPNFVLCSFAAWMQSSRCRRVARFVSSILTSKACAR